MQVRGELGVDGDVQHRAGVAEAEPPHLDEPLSTQGEHTFGRGERGHHEQLRCFSSAIFGAIGDQLNLPSF
jgi:hypothetical protein